VQEEPKVLDQERWLRLWERLGAEGSGHSIFAHLSAAYSEPGRAYHTAQHIRDCLAQLDSARHLARRPDEVEAALWFHDAVYLPGGSDNEDGSATLAEAALMACGVPPDVAERIRQLILATRHLTVSAESDTQLLCDIDLSILGREPAVFDEFERRIRLEYDWVPEAVYRTSRAEILSGFLQRRSIYQTQIFRDRYEAQARANLERLTQQLGEPH
jgi:predicted metal-dependent HD superfamily phosphohydrolase